MEEVGVKKQQPVTKGRMRSRAKNNSNIVVVLDPGHDAGHVGASGNGVREMCIRDRALAVPPGISILTLSKKAINRIENNHVKSLYFNLKLALKNGERGQTPFTPAVSILRQIHQRLLMLSLIHI